MMTPPYQSWHDIVQAKLNGISPQERGEQKDKLAITWLYRWRFSSPSLLEQVVGNTRSNLIPKLIKRGWIYAVQLHKGGYRNRATKVVALTEEGVRMAQYWSSHMTAYDLSRHQLLRANHDHDLKVQELTLARLRDNKITAYRTAHMLGGRSEHQKYPDVIWELPSGETCMVEVELTPKWGPKFSELVMRLIDAIQQEQHHLILLASDSQALLDRYVAALQPGAVYDVYARDAQRKWQVMGTNVVPGCMKGRVVWQYFI